MTTWGSWDYGGGNGMRVGFDWSIASVSNTSSSVKITIDVWTENQYSYDDSQVLWYDYDLTDADNSFTNNDGGTPQKRYTKSITHTYSTYGSSPGSWHIKAEINHAYNGVKPKVDLTIAIPARPYAAPAPPTACTEARVSDTSTTVKWTNNATAGAPYDAVWVERYVYNYTGWTRIATLGGTVTSYADTGTVANRKYAHRVQSDNSVATSAYAQSGIIWTTPAAPTAPVRTQSGTSQVLTWALAVGYTEYVTEVWRAVNGTYALLTTVGSGVTTYTDTTSSASTKVKYKFRTKTSSGTALYSAYSADTTETVGVLTAPNSPTLLVPSTGVIDPSDPIQHTWKHNPTDATSQSAFQVQYRYVGDTTWIQTGKITSTTSSWTMPADTRAKGRQVEWQVQTWGASTSLPSPFSNTATWTTSPVIPLKYPLFLDVTSGRVEADSAWTPDTGGAAFYGQAICNATFDVTTTITDVPGMAVTVPVASTSDVFLVEINFDAVTLTTGGGTFVGRCVAGSVAPYPQLIWAAGTGQPVGTRSMVTQIYQVTGLAVGNQVFKATVTETIAGVYRVNTSHSTITVTQIGGPSGQAGSKGDQGNKGDQGIQGIQGIQGVPGPQGSGSTVYSANGISGDGSPATPVQARTSGTWGTAPLDAAPYGTTSTRGIEVYVDSAGQLRAKPDIITTHQPTDLASTYPWGTSIMYIPGADVAKWPGGQQVVTHKTDNNIIAQWCTMWSAAVTKVWYRNGTSTAWAPWRLVGFADAIEQPTGINLNNLTDPGLYSQTTNAEAAAGSNYPAPYAGMLEVMADPTGTMVWQRYTLYRAGSNWANNMYSRAYASGTWSPWVLFGGEPALPAPDDAYLATDQSITSTTRGTETPTAVRVSMPNPHLSRRMLVRCTVQCWVTFTGSGAVYIDPDYISGGALATPATSWRCDAPSSGTTYMAAFAEVYYWIAAGATLVMGCAASRSSSSTSPIIRYLHTTVIPVRYE